MIVFAREVLVCRCSTDVPRSDPDAEGEAAAIRWHRGSETDFDKLDREFHSDAHTKDFSQRLGRGEYWMVGEIDGAQASYTWLSRAPFVFYPSLPGCEVVLSKDCGYGYDAWTHPDLRGKGLRRVGFLEELNILKDVWGLRWEASFFVKYQLEGATRSLASVGIVIEPLWRVWLGKGRMLEAECLSACDETATPTFLAKAPEQPE